MTITGNTKINSINLIADFPISINAQQFITGTRQLIIKMVQKLNITANSISNKPLDGNYIQSVNEPDFLHIF